MKTKLKRLMGLAGRLVHERRTLLFYVYEPGQGAGQADPRVSVYSSWAEIPASFRKVAVPAPWLSPLRRRLKRGEARLLCCSEDGRQVAAYGWIQDWRPFRRKYGALAQAGTMLGPYWTAPEARGRGLYGRLLAHSLFLCDRSRPILIGTSADNLASQRGIEKAGFGFRGRWQLRSYFGWFSRMRRL